MQRVINFSGGQTSALMTILLQPTENDVVLFTDTGREHPKTYEFIKSFEKNEGIKVHTAVYTNAKCPELTGFDAWVSSHRYLPNRVRRTCTVDLKIMTARRYIRSLGIKRYENYIGFRADEPKRVLGYRSDFKKVTTFFPLHSMGYNKAMVNEYWNNKTYRLGIPSILGNCTCCMLKGASNLIKIMQYDPELAAPWIADESYQKAKGGFKTPPTFIKGIRYKDLLEAATNQKSLFDLDTALPAFNCSCTT